ncbi:hypothetical protein G3I59_42920 [Amycolatopsis rubida]|uniref:Uncharacterized protein n=1 Tax=Amycolatopsis rubida TaxID=112413 RepID=A0ABX0C327_9PSEU|nr:MULTISPECIES: hypothetical protein [Amycolatopsis]MYW97194.1 hypothetical protein [Amycolatopsis rubida]NEC62179.1 hypothetical protein [Amycolatopsis rubida]OAP24628.1 hypothetical protein A4R44_04597 [Amycolatopsis sp. M39]
MADESLDLFGNPVGDPVSTERDRMPVNDMNLIEKVLDVAENTGYVLVGPAERVYRLYARLAIESAPANEADAVHQLLDAKWLTKGGSHYYTCHGHSGPGSSVLVPRATKEKARHWRALAGRPSTTRERERKAS